MSWVVVFLIMGFFEFVVRGSGFSTTNFELTM